MTPYLLSIATLVVGAILGYLWHHKKTKDELGELETYSQQQKEKAEQEGEKLIAGLQLQNEEKLEKNL